MSKVLMFTSPSCKPCETVKQMLANANVEYEAIDVSTQRGVQLAAINGIRNTPVIVAKDKYYVGTTGAAKFIKEQ